MFGGSSPPNYAKFSGQLGNNLYQYLHARFYSLLKGTDFYSLKLDEPFGSAKTFSSKEDNIKEFQKYKNTIKWEDCFENGIITEYPFNCSLIFKNLDLVKKWLFNDDEQQQQRQKIFKLYENVKKNMENCISLHVRIGDSLKVQKIMPFPTLDYWRKAVATALEKLNNDPALKLCIVTKYPDDNLVREIKAMLKIHFPSREVILVSNSNEKEIDFLSLMFSKGIILCSSTFSLWSAFLSDTAKVVCYPTYTHPEQNYNLYSHILPTENDLQNAKMSSKWFEIKDEFVEIKVDHEKIAWLS